MHESGSSNPTLPPSCPKPAPWQLTLLDQPLASRARNGQTVAIPRRNHDNWRTLHQVLHNVATGRRSATGYHHEATRHDPCPCVVAPCGTADTVLRVVQRGARAVACARPATMVPRRHGRHGVQWDALEGGAYGVSLRNDVSGDAVACRGKVRHGRSSS